MRQSGANSPPAEWLALDDRGPGETALLIEGRRVSVTDVREAARDLVRVLQREGLGAGERMVLALRNSERFVTALLAVRLCGATVVNLPWQARGDIARVATQCGARLVLVEEDQVAHVRHLPAVDAGRFGGALRAGDTTRDAGDAPRDAGDAPRDAREGVAWLAYTSGSTGRPKGAIHTERSLVAMVTRMARRHGVGRSDVVLVGAPVGHAAGFTYGVQLALQCRCPLVLLGRWDAREAAAAIDAGGCTFVAAPTPFLVDLVTLAESGHAPALRSLTRFLCGGAHVPEPLLARARSVLPQCDTSAYYATSETGAVTSCPPDAPEAKKRSTDGSVLPGMRLRVRDGEIEVAGDQVALGYWEGGAQASFTADGWYRTRDRGCLDADGYLRVLGRFDDMIVRGGQNVWPGEIEDVLLDHPRVQEVVVVGVDDDRLGQRLAAVVVPCGSPPTLAELHRHCEEAGLARWKRIERLVLSHELPRMPGSRKVVRHRAREMVATDGGS